MELNDIKKLLYKEQPPAHFESVTKDGILYFTYLPQTGRINFLIPLNEIGDVKWEDEGPAKLLIRYII